MTITKTTPGNFEELRQQAEEYFKDRAPDDIKETRDILEIIHELHIHQVELEIQNEELQRAQQEISDLHQKYESLYEFAPFGYLTLNSKGLITQTNLMGVKLLNLNRKYLIQSSFTRYIQHGWEHAFLSARREATKTHKKQTIELPLKSEKDQETWVQAEIEANLDEKEQVLQWRLVLVDTTAQKKVSDAYKQKAIEMEALLNGTKLLLEEKSFEDSTRKIFDICRKVTLAESGFVALLNDEGDEHTVLLMETCGFPSKVNLKMPMPIIGFLEDVYKSGKPLIDNTGSMKKWKNFLPKGHETLKNVLFSPLKDSGKSIGLIGLANKQGDFNENDVKIVTSLGEMAIVTLKQNTIKALLLESEGQLRQSQKMEAIGTLAAGIAHDFNNMLGIISGNVSYLVNQYKEDDGLLEVISDVQEASIKGQALIKQLLTFAKGGAPIKKTVNLNRVLRNIIKLVAIGRSITFDLNTNDELGIVEADEGQISQSFTNIIVNAIQASKEGAAITIVTDCLTLDADTTLSLPQGTYVYVQISDQGMGISEEHLTKIFDPFFTTKNKGYGLGLSTTYSIIKKHDGIIRVESEKGKGTTFHIYLPSSNKTVGCQDIKEEVWHYGKGKILIMDDQEAILKMTKRILGKMGYECEFAYDGYQAIECYRDAYQTLEPFDLVILDLTVPGAMGGAKTIPELLKINPDAKVVVSSGYSNDPVMSNYQSYGFCDVVPKPYTSEQIADLLNRIFGEKG